MSFSSTSSIKTVLRRLRFMPSRSRTRSRRPSISVVVPQEPEQSIDAESAAFDDASSDSSYDSDSVTGNTAPNDTPLSWCCRGDSAPDILAKDYKSTPIDSTPLVDSHVYVFNFPDSDLDFFCVGEEKCTTAPRRRSFHSRNSKSSRPRRWSAPYFLPSATAQFSRKSELPTSLLSGCEETAEDQTWSPHSEAAAIARSAKKRPAHLTLQVPIMSVAVKARGGGVAVQCASNKWGNQPPTGYI